MHPVHFLLTVMGTGIISHREQIHIFKTSPIVTVFFLIISQTCLCSWVGGKEGTMLLKTGHAHGTVRFMSMPSFLCFMVKKCFRTTAQK